MACASYTRVLEEDEVRVRASVMGILFCCSERCWIHFLVTFNERHRWVRTVRTEDIPNWSPVNPWQGHLGNWNRRRGLDSRAKLSSL